MAPFRLGSLSLILITALTLSSCSSQQEEDESKQVPRPDPGTEGWLSIDSWCHNNDCPDYLVDLLSINRRGDILTFRNWYKGTYYANAVNCKTFQVYEFDSKAAGAKKYTGGYRFNPVSSNIGPDAEVGRIFCQSRAIGINGEIRFNDEITWTGANPLSLKGTWIRHSDQIESDGPKPFEWYFNTAILKNGPQVNYAVYARYKPTETLWSKLGSWLRFSDPGQRENDYIDHAYYGWRSVNCDSGDYKEFLPLTPYQKYSVEFKKSSGFWKPREVTSPDSLSSYIRKRYC